MMNEQKESWLLNQYVWPIQSDGQYAPKLDSAAQRGEFLQFKRYVSSAIDSIRQSLITAGYNTEECYMNEVYRAFIVLRLWADCGVPPDTGGKYKEMAFLLEENMQICREIKPPHILRAEIEGHMLDASRYQTYVQEVLNQIEKEITMSQAAFQTKSYIYGQDVETMDEEQLINAIKKIEAEINNLGVVKVKSTKIAAKKTELTMMLTKVVEVLDAK